MKGEHLKYFGSGIIVLGILLAVPIGSGSILASFKVVVWAIIVGVFFIGFGELLQSMHRIELKIAGERPHYDPLTGQFVEQPK
ncbi:hypothetical protein H1230_20630 [Paenibacillus sp. 19GGS1-52]|uniref:hypothetical protein n=1 Tax=Paenibacillus sp. 19GGS1-52 TaxID=2758563 RepID=UPI001EFBF86D|nr:hypothetical protein [Paenibacillus sp. 19GGS1-52]ULO05476.1 hypothetical protein H1230_20630 [Paenibacillus sp. 19GGS1-52]